MKNLIILISSVVVLSSCQKDGHMYKACYTTPNGWLNQNQTTKSITTSFFYRETKDSVAAANWFKQTEAYEDIEAKCDSFWVEYWGTADEWKR